MTLNINLMKSVNSNAVSAVSNQDPRERPCCSHNGQQNYQLEDRVRDGGWRCTKDSFASCGPNYLLTHLAKPVLLPNDPEYLVISRMIANEVSLHGAPFIVFVVGSICRTGCRINRSQKIPRSTVNIRSESEFPARTGSAPSLHPIYLDSPLVLRGVE